MKKKTPNILTISRGIITLAIIILFLINLKYKFEIIYILFLLAVASDYFDGILARRWEAISDFGITFDPLFDKILVLSLLFLIYPLGIMPGLILIILFLRDIIIDSIRSFLLTKNIKMPAIKPAKYKTASQMLMLNFIFLFLIFPEYTTLKNLAFYFSILALVFSLWSGAIYIITANKRLQKKSN